MTVAKLPKPNPEPKLPPSTRKDITAEGIEFFYDRIKRGYVVMMAHPDRLGAPQFFGLMRRTLKISKVIGESSFQPHEKQAERTLAVAFAIYVLEAKSDTTPDQDSWIAKARSNGIQVHIARTWNEFLFAVSELEGI